ncbi:hypothetical protein [Actinoplanes flavus]|uniref:Uncharacterized protein n=1 Tax=Actinoplanes flavus TaxID=2820290 RepID=A0ABS3UL59_9ACTN|nr:hypothetical protein [Actinoplanes flavus]MBO3739499.1 hypothetical protein [Actinoplanes flavus]
MNSRRFAAALTAASTVTAAALAITASPAFASDTTFSVTVKHSNGTIVSTISGNVKWLNRSVMLTDISQYVRGGECAYATVDSWMLNRLVDYRTTTVRCPASNYTYTLGDILINGNNLDDNGDGVPDGLYSAVTEVYINLYDKDHGNDATQVRKR